uniref:Uncharacterized conserved protein YegL, contains vWA domain of TerY type n=1 Tax=Candidatus Kentrum eta TaxID=2126337 RepID=A0A450UA47_9GAMM|nr:MAG: Uncharacterized conserved protein YegL, contains vWA domain of TerY type [Candidatus Kentron sp. H]VFJ89797.1 MAG: Uncharacterized conserved protein YegL, contains vWA domain of TerY type [Candidatus Kentron sp. H]VFJ97150.1 MAG: Uncharacterized conserved protein YegL, contains vWA domain of TerY type [Candidatus Kentron sp. H]
MTDDIIPDVEFSDNKSQRLPCAIVLDASGSMAGKPIEELNAGLKVLEEALKDDPIAKKRVQLLLITIGGVKDVTVIRDWIDAMDFSAPTLEAHGLTPLGAGVRLALEKIEEQKEQYKQADITYNRPWLFIITDGEPNDEGWKTVAAEAQIYESEEKVIVWPIGVQDADMEKLQLFSRKTAVKLKGLNFKELFLWLSKSASVASRAESDSSAQSAPPNDWMEIPT